MSICCKVLFRLSTFTRNCCTACYGSAANFRCVVDLSYNVMLCNKSTTNQSKWSLSGNRVTDRAQCDACDRVMVRWSAEEQALSGVSSTFTKNLSNFSKIILSSFLSFSQVRLFPKFSQVRHSTFRKSKAVSSTWRQWCWRASSHTDQSRSHTPLTPATLQLLYLSQRHPTHSTIVSK